MDGWGLPGGQLTDRPSSRGQARDDEIPAVAVRIPQPWHPRLVWGGVQTARLLTPPPVWYDRQGGFHIPPDLVVRGIAAHRKPPDVRIWRLRNQSHVGTVPPSTSTPHWPRDRVATVRCNLQLSSRSVSVYRGISPTSALHGSGPYLEPAKETLPKMMAGHTDDPLDTRHPCWCREG
jgi:hypothetical protein